ncbi:hypothetical protein BGZ83_001362 [Gryganskiella cystojenkinii]|nr:hypothetical protein BGZ83_001362 [Gryganskiella cystojenkinii]
MESVNKKTPLSFASAAAAAAGKTAAATTSGTGTGGAGSPAAPSPKNSSQSSTAQPSPVLGSQSPSVPASATASGPQSSGKTSAGPTPTVTSPTTPVATPSTNGVEWILGMNVRVVTTADETFEGQVYAYDVTMNVLCPSKIVSAAGTPNPAYFSPSLGNVPSSSSSSSSGNNAGPRPKFDFRILKLNYIKDVTPLEAISQSNNSSAVNSPKPGEEEKSTSSNTTNNKKTYASVVPAVGFVQLDKIQQREQQAVREAQAAAARIGVGVSSIAQDIFDALSKTWAKDSIVVMDEVIIAPPYEPENCKANASSSYTLARVRKVKPKRSVARRKRPVTADAGGPLAELTSHAITTSSGATVDPVSVLMALTPTGADTTSKTSSLLTVKSTKAVARKKSSLATAQLIRRYHTLNKELSQCLARIEKEKDVGGSEGRFHHHHRSSGKDNTTTDLTRIAEIRKEMDDLGGLDMYQKASTLGQSKQRGGDSSKWLIPVIEKCHAQLNKKTDPPLTLLDIGALSPHNYQKYSSWIKTTPIDLNPQDPLITKMDFLEMPVPKKPAELFDIVCLSLVVNFVGDPAQRGEILRQSTRFLVPRTGLLYLVLPLPCIQNSRYMDHELLVEMMESIGYSTMVDHHFAKKLAYYAFRLDGDAAATTLGKKRPKLFPKKMRHDKPNRNK